MPSTALHIVRALVAEDVLQVDPQTKRYRLGVGMLPLARAVLENGDFPSMVRPKLDQLSSRYGVMAIGVEVSDLDNMIVVALARSQAPVRLHVDVRQPISRIDQRHRAMRRRVQRATLEGNREAVSPAALAQCTELRRLAQGSRYVQRQGFSIDRGNYIDGVTIVAVPVLGSRGTISHTIAAVGLGSQLDRISALALARDMRTAAQEVAAQLAPQF